mgnify:CR=1 FL=1
MPISSRNRLLKATYSFFVVSTALYGGTRGNDLNIVIQANADDTTLFDVSTYLGMVPATVQAVSIQRLSTHEQITKTFQLGTVKGISKDLHSVLLKILVQQGTDCCF